MKEKRSKYIFCLLSAILLFLLLLTSREAGINCDEVLHYNHSLAVYNYYATHGEDRSALNTPVTHLQYYGQSYDNIVTILIKWFDIEDVYGFRHIMSSVAGWLTILLTALFAVWINGYKSGILVLILFAVSPTFIGHSQNNLKDIPFALAYISGTFFTLRFLFSGKKISIINILLLTVSIAFSISIRAGGLILICYLFFFFFVYYLINYLKDKQIDFREIKRKFLCITGISIVSLLLSTLLWPYSLQNPVKNIIESYQVMTHFPDTFRQIFEGKVEWSDSMPWYYLIKSMSITIPFTVLLGMICYLIYCRQICRKENLILQGFLLFTILFPILFVMYERSNIYSSWRQFLFVYPGIVLLASFGISCFFEDMKSKYFLWVGIALFACFFIHPLKFMINDHPYYYLYYNQFVGGLKGAYSNYETDYYYVSQTEASEWLINYLKKKNVTGPVKVKATYSVQWSFRNNPDIKTSYFRYEERSQSDWDYAIVVNRYISPFQQKNNIWPPGNVIHTIYAEKVPICVVLVRKTKDDLNGFTELSEGKYRDAIKFFEKAIAVDDKDEMIFYNFAAALYNDKQYQKADSVLKKGLELNPDFEPILMYLGNIARSQNKTEEAIMYYERVINANVKYFEAYVSLSGLLVGSDLMRARSLLRTCLTKNPRYKPAIVALADSYRDKNPEIAKKYYDLADSIF